MRIVHHSSTDGLRVSRARSGLDASKSGSKEEQKLQMTVKMQFPTDCDLLKHILHIILDPKNAICALPVCMVNPEYLVSCVCISVCIAFCLLIVAGHCAAHSIAFWATSTVDFDMADEKDDQEDEEDRKAREDEKAAALAKEKVRSCDQRWFVCHLDPRFFGSIIRCK